MTTNILHISDLHFGDPKAVLNTAEVSRVLKELLTKAGPDSMLIISGDISFRGQKEGYAEANNALISVLDTVGIQRNRIIVCPGNHDIVKSNEGLSPFDAFDTWSAALRNDKHCTFSDNSCRHINCYETDYLVINSSYDGDIEYGLVDLAKLQLVLTEMDSSPKQGAMRVAVLHHHLIPFSGREDNSTTRNAYQVLTCLVRHGFSLVLHGHQHALLEFGLGNGSLKLSGVGSFRYNTPGFINGASIYRMDDQQQVSTEHYAISKDAPSFLRTLTHF